MEKSGQPHVLVALTRGKSSHSILYRKVVVPVDGLDILE